MKRWSLLISFLSIVNILFAQIDDRITLTQVGLDSLKKVVELHTGYKLFYVENKTEEPLKLTVSWDRAHFLDNLNNALSRNGYSLSQRNNFIYILKGTGINTKLPEGFFSMTKTTEEDLTAYTTALSASRTQETGSAGKVYVIGDPNVVFTGTRATLSGYVNDLDTKEPVSFASIIVVSTGTNVMTDIHGFYRIAVPLGKADLEIKGYGFEETQVKLEVFGNGSVDILVKEKVYSLQGAIISAEANQQRRTTFVGLEKISISRIRHIPAAFGEADVMKVVLTLPGVKTVGESSGGFNVRGGATDQNLILFNEGTLYNPTHLFGLFSAFNPDVVNDIELYKSSIPAKYGGRISSVLEVSSRMGNNTKITGSAGIGLLTGKLHLEGPIIKERTNFIIGARTTYSNWILGLLPKNSGYRNGAANFNDLTAGFTHKINSTNTIHLYGYYSGDKFSFGKDTTYSYRNTNFAIKWRSILSSEHNMAITAGYDGYNHNVEEKADMVRAFDMRFGLEQFFVKANFDLLINEKHTLNYGLNAINFHIAPGDLIPKESSLIAPDNVDRERAWETALFVSDKWDISRKISIEMGVRYALFIAQNSSKVYHGPEFRLSARYLLDEQLSFKAGLNTMQQNIHMLSNTVSASPIDIWKLSDSYIVPQTGWQAAAGIYRNFFNNQWELSLEGYYKAMNHYLDYKSGAVINMNKHIEEDVIETNGKAYGVEFMIKKPSGKLNGWLAYSYSRTMLKEAQKRDQTQRYEINNGNWYPASYDKPHDVKMVANYKFTQRYSLSANLDYSSGRPVTVPIGSYSYHGGTWLAYSNRNQYRIPDYFRLDIAFNIEPSHNLKLLTYSVITFGVYNLTGRKNAFSVFYTTNEREQVKGYKLSVFGAPIPYLNYTIKF